MGSLWETWYGLPSFDTVAFGQLEAVLVVWLFQFDNTYRFLAGDCEHVDPDINRPGSLRST